jgi:pimeloyl-ACP methyl ester carboxylesterase
MEGDMLRFLGRSLLALAMLTALVLAAVLSFRAWRQHVGEIELAITTPNGIDEAMFIQVGGVDEWITIRGGDRSNPVLLMVHGGPGNSLSPLATSLLDYEKDWTVVQWDQPGAGKTFRRAGGTIPAGTTITDIAADGIAVAEFVADHLDKSRIVLLGLSWGSVVGLDMVRVRPDLFTAYVGTGLFVHRDEGRVIAYERVLARARAQNNAEAVAALETIGAPPYSRLIDARTLNEWTTALATGPAGSAVDRLGQLLFAPRQSLADVSSHLRGYLASDAQFDLGAMDLRRSGKEFAVPIVIIQGAEDYGTPVELARSYLNSITAPKTELIVLEDAGHTALVDNAGAFLAALNASILPLTRTPP